MQFQPVEAAAPGLEISSPPSKCRVPTCLDDLNIVLYDAQGHVVPSTSTLCQVESAGSLVGQYVHAHPQLNWDCLDDVVNILFAEWHPCAADDETAGDLQYSNVNAEMLLTCALQGKDMYGNQHPLSDPRFPFYIHTDSGIRESLIPAEVLHAFFDELQRLHGLGLQTNSLLESYPEYTPSGTSDGGSSESDSY